MKTLARTLVATVALTVLATSSPAAASPTATSENTTVDEVTEDTSEDAAPASAANPLAPVLVTSAATGFPSTGEIAALDASRDGRVVAFLSKDASGTSVWLKDAAGKYIRADRGPSKNALPAAREVAVSGDGKLIVFTSTSPDLVAGFNPNGVPQLFRYWREQGWIDAPLRSSTNGPLNQPVLDIASSYDGTHLAFATQASNIGAGTLSRRQVFLFSRAYDTPSQVRMVSTTPTGSPGSSHSGAPSIGRSTAGLVVSYSSLASNLVANDKNYSGDVFFWTESSGKSTVVSKSSPHESYRDPSSSTAMGAADVSVHSISGDGRLIVFTSTIPYVASDRNDTYDSYVYDRISGHYRRASTTSAENDSQVGSFGASLSSDGKHVAFSGTEDLVPGARDSSISNFLVRHLESGSLARAARPAAGGPVSVNDRSYDVTARFVATGGSKAFFVTTAPLSAADTDTLPDVYTTTSSPGTVYVAPRQLHTARTGTTKTVRIAGAGFTGTVSAQVKAPEDFAAPGAATNPYDPYVSKVTFVSSNAVDVTVVVPASAVTDSGGNTHGISLQRADGVVGGCADCFVVKP